MHSSFDPSIKALIIDDNKQFMDALQNMLLQFDNIQVIDTASSVSDGILAIQKYMPDVVFLDVELKEGTGFDILKSLKEIDFEVIFTTAYESYALHAIKFSALDYLLKPFGVAELTSAINKLEKKNYHNSTPAATLMHNLANLSAQEKRIGLHTQEGVHFVALKDVIRCRSEGNYTFFYLINNEELIVSSSIKNYEEMLAQYDFIRVHNSHLINTKHVKNFIKADGGMLIMIDGAHIDVSRRRKDELLNLLSKF